MHDSECTVVATRTGNDPVATRFAGLLQPKPDATVRFEQNRATTLQDEQDFNVRPDISLQNERRCPFMGLEREIA